jgi:hypothetical protein
MFPLAWGRPRPDIPGENILKKWRKIRGFHTLRTLPDSVLVPLAGLEMTTYPIQIPQSFSGALESGHQSGHQNFAMKCLKFRLKRCPRQDSNQLQT